jgi:hypothetical protein
VTACHCGLRLDGTSALMFPDRIFPDFDAAALFETREDALLTMRV